MKLNIGFQTFPTLLISIQSSVEAENPKHIAPLIKRDHTTFDVKQTRKTGAAKILKPKFQEVFSSSSFPVFALTPPSLHYCV